MRFVASERRGCEGSVAKRISITFGWGISRRRCRSCIPAWDEELEQRLQEAEIVGVGFDVPAYAAPNAPKVSAEPQVAIGA